MAGPDAPLPRLSPQLTELLRIAASLRGLPSAEFKQRLKADLTGTSKGAAARAGRAPRKAATPRRVKPIPQGYRTATTCLVVREAPRAIEFYQRAFGATELMRHADPGGHIVHAEIMIGDTRIAIADEAPEYNLSPQALGGSPAIVQLYVDDVDAFADRAVAAGAKVIFPINDQFYGDRSGRLADPFGHLWIVATHVEDVSPAEMNRRMQAYAREQAAGASAAKPSTATEPVVQEFHSITPFLIVDEVPKVVDFLKEAFEAVETLRTVGGDPPHMHAEVKVGDSMVMLGEGAGKFEPMPTAFHLYVKDSDAVYKRALRAGASSLHGPTDQDYGDREASVKDPFGNHWYIGTHKQGGSYVPAGLRSVTPYLHPKGTQKVIDFLKRVFDANEVFRAEGPDGTIHHAKIRIGDSMLEMGEAQGPYQPMPPAIYLNVGDVDVTYRRALRARATSVQEPADQRYGDRNAGVKDPFGNVWFIAKHLEKDLEDKPQAKEEPTMETNPTLHGVMPFIYIKGADKAAAFYAKVLGATEMMRLKQPGGVVSHVQIKVGESLFMIRDPGTPDLADYRKKGYAISAKDLGGTPVHLYLYVEDADAVFQKALEAGSKVVNPISDTEWGDRCGGIQDPFGQIWYLATPLKRFRASHQEQEDS